MLFEPSAGVGVLLNVGLWSVWSVVVGYAGHRVDERRFEHDTWLTRPRAFERDGRVYERLGIRRWKGWLPELGALFTGGFAKRSVSRDKAHVARFVRETRRAELVHWIVMVAAPVSVLWNPPWGVAVMFAYAIVANVPCVVVQRYNRARLRRVLARM
jgi:glycosyl-4,4'-diaponeurosporenoate acyltransferase